LRCSEQTSLSLALIGTGFSYNSEIRRQQLDVLAAQGQRLRDIRRMGAASLDLCAVASGRLDAYWERNLQPWDVAAGMLIAQEAGAIVTDFSGHPVSHGDVLASSPGIHKDLIDLLA
jgi:myo-inositol-1(or 4)-monophosphatase